MVRVPKIWIHASFLLGALPVYVFLCFALFPNALSYDYSRIEIMAFVVLFFIRGSFLYLRNEYIRTKAINFLTANIGATAILLVPWLEQELLFNKLKAENRQLQFAVGFVMQIASMVLYIFINRIKKRSNVDEKGICDLLFYEPIYRKIRFPGTLAGLLFLPGFCIAISSFMSAILSMILILATARFRKAELEALEKYHSAYETYANRTKRLIPYVY